MRLITTAVTAAALMLAMSAPSFAMAKMDGDAWLKMIFHGKPGAWMMDMKMPMAKAKK
jgi:hypothetical protein